MNISNQTYTVKTPPMPAVRSPKPKKEKKITLRQSLVPKLAEIMKDRKWEDRLTVREIMALGKFEVREEVLRNALNQMDNQHMCQKRYGGRDSFTAYWGNDPSPEMRRKLWLREQHEQKVVQEMAVDPDRIAEFESMSIYLPANT